MTVSPTTTTSTYLTTSTVTTSYPVIVTSLGTETVTSFTTSTFTTVSTSLSVSVSLVTQSITLTGPTVTAPGTTVTNPGPTVTAPGSTVTSVVTTSLPGFSTTITQGGSTVTSFVPGSTSTYTTTLTLPGGTVTQIVPGEQVTITGGETTVTITQAITCPMPTENPASPNIPQAYGANTLWGCLPGYVCSPPKPAGCALWANPPNYDYKCAAKNCVPAPPFTDVVWPPNSTAYYPPQKNYYNLNPKAFGLDYTIFVTNVVVKYVTKKHGYSYLTTITTAPADYYASKTSLTHYSTSSPAPKKRAIVKRDETIVPAVCYASCNNCFIEAQKLGKSPALCVRDSAFNVQLDACRQCIDANEPTVKGSSQIYVEPKFAVFLEFCNPSPAQSEVAGPDTTTTVENTEVVSPVPQSTTTPESVAITTQAPPAPTDTPTPTPSETSSPVETAPPETSDEPTTSLPTDFPTPVGPSNGTATTTAPPEQITGASAHLRPSILLATILALSLLSLLI